MTLLVRIARKSQPQLRLTCRSWNGSEDFRTIEQLARNPGMEGPISSHSFRHHFSTSAQFGHRQSREGRAARPKP